MGPKNPRTPQGPLDITSGDIVLSSAPVWRIHTVQGGHSAAWNEFREFGPVVSMRWDPHAEPCGQHPGCGVLYTAENPDTVFAEVFQSVRTIGLTSDRLLTAWTPVRQLELLDLMPGSDWAVRHGASASLPQTPRNTCRNWAREIHRQLAPDIDGIRVPSTMTADAMIVLFVRAMSALPTDPDFSRPLTHPAVQVLAARASDRFSWDFLD
ncbi:RES family NAD+ phosphorylase [Corynebacterium variabile]|uniref:RES family NAD+ phosphorylase n=1 Tax=Corynebacterium variabile TaxID=1727 RepID=UPI0002002E6D|nr:RES family NAD+ phosphorylase [Corynebacterium variabile]